MSLPAGWDEFVQAQIQARADAIERACEAALQGGKHGVLVDEVDGVVSVSEHVPYGQIYYCRDGIPDDWR